MWLYFIKETYLENITKINLKLRKKLKKTTHLNNTN